MRRPGECFALTVLVGLRMAFNMCTYVTMLCRTIKMSRTATGYKGKRLNFDGVSPIELTSDVVQDVPSARCTALAFL